ncbi:MAG: spore germination protein GerW family protein [Acidobacteriota bacterium]|nr:spore germination protein GerW family protein [Acidobacteriota bacterium]
MKTKYFFTISLAVLFLSSSLVWSQAKSPLEESFSHLDKMISTLKVSSIIGKPIRSGDTYVVPFAKISFGFGAGGMMMGYGGGMGAKTIPLGILIIEGENVRVELFPVEEKKPSFFQDMLPVLFKMLPQIMGDKFPSFTNMQSHPVKPAEKFNNLTEEGSLEQIKKLFDEEKYSEALEMADSVIAKNPNNADLYAWKGNIMGSMAQGNPMNMMKYGMGAMQAYEKALKLDPDNAMAHFGRGMGRLMAPPGFGGDLDGAIGDLEFACKKEPFPESYYQLGVAYQKKGSNNKAKEAFKKALELKPDYPDAAKALAELK